jgi:acetylornithine deacetylase
VAVRCDVHGVACHSAHAPAGVNAIEYAAQLINELGRLGKALRAEERQDKRFDPPFSTVQVGVIGGGAALNIVPEHCRFDFEVRSLPVEDPNHVITALHTYAKNELLPAMQAVSGQSDIRLTELSSYPGLDIPMHSQAAELIAEFCGSRAFGTVAFGTEGGLFDQSGIPAVVCGPGSMAQGHKPDEFISVEQLDACDRMLRQVLAFVIRDR